MQSTALLLRQSLRQGLCLSNRPLITTRAPAALARPPVGNVPARQAPVCGAVCARCQFRAQVRWYSSRGGSLSQSDGAGKDNASCKEELSAEDSAKAETTSKPDETQQNGNSVLNGGKKDLPSEAENRRSNMSKQFSTMMDNLQSNVFLAGQRLNDLTGYSSIEKLKQEIITLEERVRQSRARVRETKDAYTSAINRRSTSQREVNELLQRKHAWSPADLERFTSLYRSDHANERAESDAQQALLVAEQEADEAAARLNRSILARYHEEQIWSDKIRRMSTWWTWGLMGVNVLLFLVFQIAVEPWRRSRLVRGFEEKVMEALQRENGKAGVEGEKVAATTVHPHVHRHRDVIPETIRQEGDTDPLSPLAVVEPVSPAVTAELSAGEPVSAASAEPTAITEPQDQQQQQPTSSLLPPDASLSPDSWRQTIHDMFSDRRLTLSQRDLTTVALESAAAGAAVMGMLIAVFRPR